jgi:hypothetical protein
MQVDDPETGHGDEGSRGHLTLLFYPDGHSTRSFYLDKDRSVTVGSRRDAGNLTVEISPQSERYILRIKEPARPQTVQVDRGGGPSKLNPISSWDAFNGSAEGWYYDELRHYLWVRFATQESAAQLTYSTLP